MDYNYGYKTITPTTNNNIYIILKTINVTRQRLTFSFVCSQKFLWLFAPRYWLRFPKVSQPRPTLSSSSVYDEKAFSARCQQDHNGVKQYSRDQISKRQLFTFKAWLTRAT